MSVSYGVYNFPNPEPILAESNVGVYHSGVLDYVINNVRLIGALTGSSIHDIYHQKVELISGLSSGYAQLTVGNTGYSYANPNSISFADSSQSRYLPYDIAFTAYENKSFTNFFGIINPSDTWEFSEQEGRIVNAIHSVSAQGVKIDGNDPLINARNFVNNNLNGYNNDISFSWTGVSGFLIGKNEEVNRVNNTYSATENYLFSTSHTPINNSGIISANSQIAYDKENGVSIRVNGKIQGGLTGYGYPLVTTGMLSTSTARLIATNALHRSKSSYEEEIYKTISRSPSSYNYTINEESNVIDFSFEFKKALSQNGDPYVLNTYSVSVNASKDDGIVSATIDGLFQYNGAFDIFSTTGDPKDTVRWGRVYSGFESFDPYPIVLDYYTGFSLVNIYDSGDLYSTPVSFSINKDPFNSQISYNYTYDNRLDITSGDLNNAQFSINYTQPIAKTGIVETILSFAKQQTHSRTAGIKNVQASSENTTGDSNANVNLLKSYATGLIRPFSVLTSDDYTASQSSISVNLSALY